MERKIGLLGGRWCNTRVDHTTHAVHLCAYCDLIITRLKLLTLQLSCQLFNQIIL